MSGRFPSCSKPPLEEGGLSGSPLLWHACPAPHAYGRRRAPCWVSRVPRSLRTTFPVQQMPSAPLVGVVARAAGKGGGAGGCRLCVAGDRAGRRRTLMLQGSGGYGPSLLCLLLLSTSCRYLRSASSRLDELRHNENPPEKPSQWTAGTLARPRGKSNTLVRASWTAWPRPARWPFGVAPRGPIRPIDWHGWGLLRCKYSA